MRGDSQYSKEETQDWAAYLLVNCFRIRIWLCLKQEPTWKKLLYRFEAFDKAIVKKSGPGAINLGRICKNSK